LILLQYELVFMKRERIAAHHENSMVGAKSS